MRVIVSNKNIDAQNVLWSYWEFCCWCVKRIARHNNTNSLFLKIWILLQYNVKIEFTMLFLKQGLFLKALILDISLVKYVLYLCIKRRKTRLFFFLNTVYTISK